MKLTKEDIKKYGTLKEISTLNKSKVYFYLQSMTDKIIDAQEEEDAWERTFDMLVNVYESGEMQK
jgi:hypothetical protein